MSPVSTQPSTMRCFVPSGSFQKPVICPSARATIWPGWPRGSGLLSPFQISTSANGTINPQERSGTWDLGEPLPRPHEGEQQHFGLAVALVDPVAEDLGSGERGGIRDRR